MSKTQGYVKTHHVAGIVLAIIGIAIALFTSVVIGLIGCGVAAILGIIAIVLGIMARKMHKGMGAIILGIICVALAVLLGSFSITTVNTLHEVAVDLGDAPMIEEYTEQPYFGLMGIIMRAASHEDIDTDELSQQLERVVNEMNKRTDTATTTTTATEAPAEAAATDAPAEETTGEETTTEETTTEETTTEETTTEETTTEETTTEETTGEETTTEETTAE